MGEANIKRGEKWTKSRELAVFQKRDKDVAWLDSQKSIVADMKEYAEDVAKKKAEDVAKKKAEEAKETKSKKEK